MRRLSDDSHDPDDLSPARLRAAFGLFPTGVAVITGLAPSGEPLGMTVSSFTSVSLAPPLVSFAVAATARSAAAWQIVMRWAVNVLAEGQNELSTRFARALTDKWAGVETLPGEGGMPLLSGAIAHLECETHARIEGGDHLLILGRVVRLRTSACSEPRPLVFFGSRYRRLDLARPIPTPDAADLWVHGW